MAISRNEWKRLFPGVLKVKPYQIVLHDDSEGWNTDKSWVDVAEAWNETRRHDEEYIVHNSHGTDVDAYYYDGPIKPLAEEGLSRQAQIFADAEAAGRALLEAQFPDVSVSRLLYCANTTLVFQAEDKAFGQVAIKLTGMKNGRRSDMEATLPVLKELGKKSHLVPLLRYEWLEAERGQTVLVQWMPCLHRAQPKAKPDTGLEALGADLRKIPYIQKIGSDIAKALKELHSMGLVHLDVKLDNLFFAEENGVLTAYLGDYSSVKPVKCQYEGHTSFTFDHAAPELRARMPYSYGVDVYAWGQMMLRLLRNLTASGLNLTAFVANKQGKLNDVWLGEEASERVVDRFRATDAHIPFLPTIMRAVNRDPKLRYADGDALCTGLEDRSAFDPSDFRDLPASTGQNRQDRIGETGNSGKQKMPGKHRFLAGYLLLILFLAILANHISGKPSTTAQSTHSTYTLLKGDAAAQAVEVRLLEAQRTPIGCLFVTVEVTNLSETSIVSILGKATITAGDETFAGVLLIGSMEEDLEPGQTKRVPTPMICDEDQKESATGDGTKLKDPVMEFAVADIQLKTLS